MNHRLEDIGDALEKGVPFRFSLTFVEGAEVVDLYHDHRDAVPLTRRAAPLALQKLLKVLLRVKPGDGVDGGLVQQLVFDEGQLFGSFVQCGLEGFFAAPRATRPEQVARTDEEGGENGKRISHSPALFYTDWRIFAVYGTIRPPTA